MSNGDARTGELFRRLRELGDERARAELAEAHDGLVRFLAGKFANRGEPLDDLIQVGRLALLMAIDRFDDSRGLKFSTFATPTIVGEIKRHFRDRAWSIRVPRSLQELSQQVARAAELLTARLGRSPSIPEIAAELGCSEEDALRAMDLGHAFEPVSLDAQIHGDGEGSLSVADSVGHEDADMASFAQREDLRAALERLDDREQAILRMRFVEELSQSDVAARLGISQMHVSRLQARALQRLRKLLEG